MSSFLPQDTVSHLTWRGFSGWELSYVALFVHFCCWRPTFTIGQKILWVKVNFPNSSKIKINAFFVIGVGILTHSLEVTELDYPSITICKEKGLYDPGEYIRPIFNQFQYACSNGDSSCNKTELLREHYQEYVRVDGGLKIDFDSGNQFWSSDSDDSTGIAYTTYLFGLVTSWLAHL